MYTPVSKREEAIAKERGDSHGPRRGVFDNLILHVHPRTVPEQTLKFTLTWGLGGMAFLLVLLQIATGILLMLVYEPSPGKAYESILILQNEVFFGQYIRNIHYWSANILVVVVFLHLLRVYFTGAFYKPRQFNWILGSCLLFFVLLSNFTGYLLPWDQLAFWAITICTGMFEYIPGLGMWLQKVIRGGSEVGSTTLLIFFTLHTSIFPFCLILFMAFHFWHVRRAGGVVMPRHSDEEQEMEPNYVSTIPNLVFRELAVALVLIALIFMFSTFSDVSLADHANPGMSPNPTKAPWYFAGIQEMLLHIHPLFAVFILPAAALLGLMILPYLPYQTNATGVWFVSRVGQQTALLASVVALVFTATIIILDEFVVHINAGSTGLSPAISHGLLPTLLLLLAVIVFYLLVQKKFTANRNECVQAVFVLLTVAFVVMTVTCALFRGEGMKLMWPW
ncbi:MAG: cytochrome b N-terminal domain-containing protein [Desulfobacteraceae bacterium]|jgi:quinol-cytochrome oxidoreductase complex cytochrome b subunit